MVEKHSLTFLLLRDQDNQPDSQFGLTLKLPDELAGLYSKFGIDLVKFYDNDHWSLPLPARFVLDQEGKVVSAEANPDNTQRPEPSEIVEVLKKIG